MTRRGQSKHRSLRTHARRRAMERYGVEFSNDTRRLILEAIHSGRSRVVRSQSLRVKVHDVDVGGVTMRVVYDRQRKEVITLLRPDWT